MSGTRKPISTLQIGAALFALFTAFGLWNFGIIVTEKLSSREFIPLLPPLVNELTGAYAGLLLLWPVVAFMRRFPITRETWVTRLPLHLIGVASFGAADTLLMWGIRSAVYPLLGLGAYYYGDMRYRFAMEFHKQFIAYWGVYLAVSLLAYARKARERELREKEMERLLAESRLDALRNQLDPHFLFNTLNMISSHLHGNPSLADKMIARLSDFLRLTLGKGGRREVPLAEEIESLKSYLSIMEARFEDRLAVTLEVDAGARGGLVPLLLLQPLAENAVKHGTCDPSAPWRIEVRARRAGDLLEISVRDGGPGLAGDRVRGGGEGVGLKNTAERLRLLYGEAARMELKSPEGGGFEAVLSLPYREALPSEELSP